MARPFFSIGVTTFRRRELLRQTLESILEQSFPDFEVIVGNDDTTDILRAEDLGVTDPRVRVVNNPSNLREVGNMNALLAMASGRYFTWLADDDLLQRDHLRIVHEQLVVNDHPDALFPSYEFFRGTTRPASRPIRIRRTSVLSGREFLDRYFEGKLKLISVYGLFDTGRLRSVLGGMEELYEGGVGFYAEYLFLVKCGRLDRIVFVDAPLVLNRAHEQSWGSTNLDLERYAFAGRELVRRCAIAMEHPALAANRAHRLRSLCAMHLDWFSWTAAAVEIAAGNPGPGSFWRAFRRHGEEARGIRNALEDANAAEGARTSRTVLYARLRGAYSIAGMIVMSWLRRLRGHPRIARDGTP